MKMLKEKHMKSINEKHMKLLNQKQGDRHKRTVPTDRRTVSPNKKTTRRGMKKLEKYIRALNLIV